MLGRLARRLRLLGIDVQYEPRLKGIAGYRQARSEGRIFLTRQQRFRNMADTLFVESDDINQQIEQVKRALNISGERVKKDNGLLSRCSVCNETLKRISRDDARPAVPFYIYQIHTEFRRCPKCHRVYWPGSHIQKIKDKEENDGGCN